MKRAKGPELERKKEEENQEEKQEEKQEEQVQMPDALTYLCINTADLEDVSLVLTAFKKRFYVVQGPLPPLNVTGSPLQ